MKVHNVESCNCNPGCPCNFDGFPDHGSCEAVVGYQVIEGNYGDVDLAGVKAVAIIAWPKAIHEGHGKAALFISEGARPEQVEAFAKILSGQDGGLPWEILASTIESLTGPVVTPIEMTVDGRRSHFTIDGVCEVDLTPLKNPVTGEEHEIHMVIPRGFIWKDGDAATTSTMRASYGDIRMEHPGKHGVYAIAEWTNQA
jgi:hypothetical protein